jgi:hypothetical protein
MHGQLLTRRVFLAALVTMVALIHGESVAEGSQSHPRPDFGSAEGFRLECELLGGTFSADGIGNTNLPLSRRHLDPVRRQRQRLLDHSAGKIATNERTN